MYGTRTLRFLLSVGAALLWSASAHAAGKDCTGIDSLKDNPALEAAKVASTDKKTFFIKSEMDDKACPAATSGCRRRAFLVPGNAIVVSGHVGDLACATFANAKVETSGWLPEAALTIDADAPAPDWAGTWIREEAQVTIKTDADGKLAIHGDATFGALDPDRVKRGGVNVGEIAGRVTAKGDRLSFAMGDNDKTLPVDKGDDSTCKVWMRRIGAYLLVDDNNACGGMNVSFRGTYVRR